MEWIRVLWTQFLDPTCKAKWLKYLHDNCIILQSTHPTELPADSWTTWRCRSRSSHIRWTNQKFRRFLSFFSIASWFFFALIDATSHWIMNGSWQSNMKMRHSARHLAYSILNVAFCIVWLCRYDDGSGILWKILAYETFVILFYMNWLEEPILLNYLGTYMYSLLLSERLRKFRVGLTCLSVTFRTRKNNKIQILSHRKIAPPTWVFPWHSTKLECLLE